LIELRQYVNQGLISSENESHIYDLFLEKKYDSVKSILKYIDKGQSKYKYTNSKEKIVNAKDPIKISTLPKQLPINKEVGLQMEQQLETKAKKIKLADYNQIVQNILEDKHANINESAKQEIQKKKNEELLKKEEEESLKLAKELMEKDEKEYSERANKSKETLSIECGICADAIEEKDIFPMYLCTHLFHKECIARHIETQLQNKKFPIMCPNEECKQEIDERDIEDFLSKETLSKYKTFRLSSFIEANSDEYSCCPTADCNYIFFYEKDTDSNFECPMCKKQYCLSCRCPYHQGQTCAEYKITNEHTVNA
jgi:hypothetical protein